MICFLFEISGFYIQIQINIFDKKCFSYFSNGPISQNSILISKISNNKVMVIISILIIIYRFNWSWHQWKNNNIHFTCFCKIFNKSILFSFEMILTTSPPDKKNHSVRNTSFIYRYIYISSDYSQKKQCKLVINVLSLF